MTDRTRYTCPFCGGSLKLGSVRLASNFWRFLLAGSSWSRLDFLHPGERLSRKSIILDQGEEQSACKCESCGTVSIFNGPRPKDSYDPENY